MSARTKREGQNDHNFHWLSAVLLAVIALAFSGCQQQSYLEGVEPMPVVVPPWMPSDEPQVVSNGVAFAWHDVFFDADNIYFMYTLVSDPNESGLAEAVPIDPVLRTDPSATRPGHAVPLASWKGVSTGVLVFPGCVEDGETMQIEFDKVATDQGEHEGQWSLQALKHLPNIPIFCGGAMAWPNAVPTEYADKTIWYNGQGVNLGNMAYNSERISKGLLPSPPEVDPSLIPDDPTSLIPPPAETNLTSVPGATSTPPALSQPSYLQQTTLRIVDEPSQAVQFVVITILPDGTIESQTYEGVANPVESLEPTVPPSPINP